MWFKNTLYRLNLPRDELYGLLNVDSGNDLVPHGNNPIPEPMLTEIFVATLRH